MAATARVAAKARVVAVAAAAAVAAFATIASCTLFQDDLPDRSCRQDGDCFRAQGERCDLMTRTCVIAPDAAPVADAIPASMVDAAPMVDAP